MTMPSHVRDALRSGRAQRFGWRVLLGLLAGSFLYGFAAPSERRAMRTIAIAAAAIVAGMLLADGRWMSAAVVAAFGTLQAIALVALDGRGDLPRDRHRAARHEAYRAARIEAGFLAPGHCDPRD